MSFTLTPGYNWSDGEVVTETKLDLAATPTLANDQTYTFGAGTAAAPSVNFTGGTTTGLYLGSSSIGFAVGGASMGTWSASALTVTPSGGLYVRKSGSTTGGGAIYLSGYDSTTQRDWSIRDDNSVDRLRFARGATDYTFYDVLKVPASDSVSQQSWKATTQFDWTIGSTAIAAITSTGLAVIGSASAAILYATNSFIGTSASNSTQVYNSNTNQGLDLLGGPSGARIQLFGSTHASFANQTYYDASTHYFRANGGGSVFFSLDSTNATIGSGIALKLGNAYQAGAPAATGYVTLKDSAGTTYKVLVAT